MNCLYNILWCSVQPHHLQEVFTSQHTVHLLPFVLLSISYYIVSIDHQQQHPISTSSIWAVSSSCHNAVPTRIFYEHGHVRSLEQHAQRWGQRWSWPRRLQLSLPSVPVIFSFHLSNILQATSLLSLLYDGNPFRLSTSIFNLAQLLNLVLYQLLFHRDPPLRLSLAKRLSLRYVEFALQRLVSLSFFLFSPLHSLEEFRFWIIWFWFSLFSIAVAFRFPQVRSACRCLEDRLGILCCFSVWFQADVLMTDRFATYTQKCTIAAQHFSD